MISLNPIIYDFTNIPISREQIYNVPMITRVPSHISLLNNISKEQLLNLQIKRSKEFVKDFYLQQQVNNYLQGRLPLKGGYLNISAIRIVFTGINMFFIYMNIEDQNILNDFSEVKKDNLFSFFNIINGITAFVSLIDNNLKMEYKHVMFGTLLGYVGRAISSGTVKEVLIETQMQKQFQTSNFKKPFNKPSKKQTIKDVRYQRSLAEKARKEKAIEQEKIMRSKVAKRYLKKIITNKETKKNYQLKPKNEESQKINYFLKKNSKSFTKLDNNTYIPHWPTLGDYDNFDNFK